MRPSFCKSTFWPDNRTVCSICIYTPLKPSATHIPPIASKNLSRPNNISGHHHTHNTRTHGRRRTPPSHANITAGGTYTRTTHSLLAHRMQSPLRPACDSCL